MVAHTPPNVKCPFLDIECPFLRRVFERVMKYLCCVLIGHEIFFKIFDGPQNIFLCSIFVILFFKLRELRYKISKLAISKI